ncbi:hypothetical protein [Mesorhizobium sp. SP-1A]|uniref:hypothetical protein n=1 Tax=Mesorhizobium sp. SP-1A TaxID=3077840 RepID=UPI0028F6E4E3|nr:hypothetical protein [Mesorhizobium sp. SP-1A]
MPMDRDQMMEYARVLGDCNDEQTPIADFEWSETELSVEALLTLMSAEEWKEFWIQELDIAKYDLEDELRWSRLAVEEIEEPIVVVQKDDGSYSIWDGWHRSAATVVTGRATIKAVFGKHHPLSADLDEPAAPRM